VSAKANDNRSVDELNRAIIDEYETTKSIAKIAEKLQTNQVRVQRVLITEGLWTSKRTEQIAELRAQGLSVEQIADQLGKDVKTIQTFLPYSRGQYGRSESDDAARSKDYRDRMNTAAEKMIKKEREAMNDEFEIREDGTMYVDLDTAYLNGANGQGNINLAPHTEEELENNPFLTDASVYRLKLELVDHFRFGDRDSLGMKEDELKEFLRLSKAKNGIIREVLVPSTMNLHSMHFMIQRLFGWQNGHLHHFSISEQEFDQLTGGTIGGWERLCGSLLHYPDEETDMYWDDDYSSDQSVKSWLKKKYNGPYVQKSVNDTYFDTRRQIYDFRSRFTQFTDDMTLEEMDEQVIMEEPLNYLSERITIGQLLMKKLPDDKKERKALYKNWLKRLDSKKQIIDDKIGSLGPRRGKDLEMSCDNLKNWRNNRDRIEEWKYYGTESDIKARTGKSSKQWLEQADEFIPYFEKLCAPIFKDYNPKLIPITDTLYYEYDPGDGWCVKITVLDKYDRKTNADLSNSSMFVVDIMTEKDRLKKNRYFQDGKEVDPELREILAYVDAKERPRCTAADGLNVVDDVGGLGGFHEMLLTLEGDDPEEKESMKEWARGMGWTGKMTKPENIL